jgi:hypothetical protein
MNSIRAHDEIVSALPHLTRQLRGEAVMESQIVVDYTEVDANGYVIGGVGNESHPTDQLCELKYMLRLESRELRDQSKQRKSGWAVPGSTRSGTG